MRKIFLFLKYSKILKLYTNEIKLVRQKVDRTKLKNFRFFFVDILMNGSIEPKSYLAIKYILFIYLFICKRKPPHLRPNEK